MMSLVQGLTENSFPPGPLQLGAQERAPYGTLLVVQWLKLFASNVRGAGLLPGQGTKIFYKPYGVAKNIFLVKKNIV